MDNQEEVSSEKTEQYTSWSSKVWAEERGGGCVGPVGVRAGDRRDYRLERRGSRSSRLALDGASLDERETEEHKTGRGSPGTEVAWSWRRGARAGGAGILGGILVVRRGGRAGNEPAHSLRAVTPEARAGLRLRELGERERGLLRVQASPGCGGWGLASASLRELSGILQIPAHELTVLEGTAVTQSWWQNSLALEKMWVVWTPRGQLLPLQPAP